MASRAALLAMLLATVPASGNADVIASTPFGGPWQLGTTWMGGTVPGNDDTVIIQGPVEVMGAGTCLGLTVTSAGSLSNGAFSPSSLSVSGPIVNQGTIEDGEGALYLRVGGDITNDATWTNQMTLPIGALDRHLNAGPQSIFESNLTFDATATGNVIVDAPFAILGNIDTGSGRMVLEPGCPLTLRQGSFMGELLCNGNEVRFESWSYLDGARLDAAVLVGEVEVTGGIFTGGLTVMDVLQNLSSAGSAGISVEGDLVNNGLICNHTYGLTVNLSGNLICNGVISCSQVVLDESAPHHLTMGPGGDLDTALLLPEFEASTLIVETDATISGSMGLGLGTTILSPGSSLDLPGHGSIHGGTLLAGGNDIRMGGLGSLGQVVIDNAVLRGLATLAPGCSFTGGVVVEDTLRAGAFFAPEAVVTGPILNNGVIHDGLTPLAIRALGDVTNAGEWGNSRIFIDGTEDQAVEVGEGIDVPAIELESNLTAAPYQWYRDGLPIPGATSATLTFATLGADDIGAYHCQGDGQVLSRTIVITAGPVVGVSSQTGVLVTVLETGRPNPFRSVTSIGFALGEAAAVQLGVFDVAGRQVSSLVDDVLNAGRYDVSWHPEHVSPGVYFLKLRAGRTSLVRKVTLVE